MKKKILLLTPSPLKKNVVQKVYSKIFTDMECVIDSYDTGNHVFKHILSKDDCLKQMRELTVQAKSEYQDYDYYISMMGRFDVHATHMEECALVLVQNKNGIEGYSQAASFNVPNEVSDLLQSGISFSNAVEKVFNIENVKEGSGFVGFLTKGVVTKSEQYFQPVVIALSTCLMNEASVSV